MNIVPKPPKFVIVAGASAGGIRAMSEFVAQIQDKIDAAVFIVVHLSNSSVSDFLVHRLQRHTALQCRLASNGMSIHRGFVYIAPANFHLVIKKEQMILGYGPEENRWRPSIDVLFRSAAVAYGEAVIGVILTGLLDDGTAGMMAINKCGGTTIVQDPDEAEYPDMPLSVLNNMEVNYSLPLAQMGFVIFETTKNKQFKGIKVPPELTAESAIAERTASGIDMVRPIAQHSEFSCPDCGGVLWEIKDGNFHRYRCNTGHAYSQKDLLHKQGEEVEASIWVALRLMEERTALLKKMGTQETAKGLLLLANGHFNKAAELEVHIGRLKDLLIADKLDPLQGE